jgi:hypothetical protein
MNESTFINTYRPECDVWLVCRITSAAVRSVLSVLSMICCVQTQQVQSLLFQQVTYLVQKMLAMYSGRNLTASFGNVTVRGEKDGKGKGEARWRRVCLSIYSITENIYYS